MINFKNSPLRSEASQDKDLWRLGLTAFVQMSGAIAMPVLIALFIGRFLDQKYNTGYLYFLSLTGIAFVISCVSIALVGLKYLKQVNKTNKISVVIPPQAGAQTSDNDEEKDKL